MRGFRLEYFRIYLQYQLSGISVLIDAAARGFFRVQFDWKWIFLRVAEIENFIFREPDFKHVNLLNPDIRHE